MQGGAWTGRIQTLNTEKAPTFRPGPAIDRIIMIMVD